MKHAREISEIQFIDLKDVKKIACVSRSTIYAWMNRGYFPKSVAIGPRAMRFRLQDVRDWCEDPAKWREEHTHDT